MVNRLRRTPLASVLLAIPLLAAEPSTDAWLDQTRARWVGRGPEDLGDAGDGAEGEEVLGGAGGGAREGRVPGHLGHRRRADGVRRDRRLRKAGRGAARRVRRAARPLAGGGQGEEAGARRERAGPRLRAQPARHRGVAAAIAANRERIARKLPGTIQLFGTPAEEQLYGKTLHDPRTARSRTPTSSSPGIPTTRTASPTARGSPRPR